MYEVGGDMGLYPLAGLHLLASFLELRLSIRFWYWYGFVGKASGRLHLWAPLSLVCCS